MKWQTREELRSLLINLVGFDSITGHKGEVHLIEYVEQELKALNYFKENPELVQTDLLDDGRKLLTALVKAQKPTKKTIILLSHIDVVGIDDYGSFKDLAFNPDELTQHFRTYHEELPNDAKIDLQSSEEWLFGRGIMDMKAGSTLHLSMLERAINEQWDGNILLLLVPDEEVNSAGMLKARETLNWLKQTEDLEYILCINSEPMFRQFLQDQQKYLYTGSLGKALPGFFCYGKESHVGEPFNGLNANLMLSYLNINLELNHSLSERVGEEVTPPPISLMNRDLKEHYSVQTPLTAVSMYNVLLMRQAIPTLTKQLMDVMKRTKVQVETHVKQQAEANGYQVNFDIKLLDYHTLYEEAVKRHGKELVNKRREELLKSRVHGDRDFNTLLVQDLAFLCKDLAPMMILFYSPPYYPAVSSEHNLLVSKVANRVSQVLKDQYSYEVKTLNYFNGISDLSYIGYDSNKESNLKELYRQMPLNEKEGLLKYLEEDIDVPSINIGPVGKDPHQWTERLNIDYSLEQLPNVLADAIKFSFKKSLIVHVKKLFL
ncbi:M20/M25/M40 family metallo-hydrolase [Piscibacillus salipiscarius]|uniref:M20/M25/M40 family metallo-hydrolase n=1 Tax=Piscibacillus salipiscarius TaxID=299480 RepID=UPI0006D22673|nr:M20/M25/M40 family metallo-hydrolase [Piscibacillus salipiscarius]